MLQKKSKLELFEKLLNEEKHLKTTQRLPKYALAINNQTQVHPFPSES